REGIRVVPVPGPSAALAAYSASGFGADRFLFVGFLPAARGARRKALAALDAACPVIIYEAPHRVLETVQDLCERFGGARELLLARELTKKFEEIARLPLGEAGPWLLAQPHRQQGAFVFVLGPESAPRTPDRVEGERVLGILLKELPASDAARLAARITGLPRAELYAVTLGKKGKDAG
ncbi:MAG: SAM-dependent methyltransferase, partial [Burkholderiales bacterium]